MYLDKCCIIESTQWSLRFRIVECVACIVCLILALMVSFLPGVILATQIVFVGASVMFTLATFFDLFIYILRHPYHCNQSWIMFSTTGMLLFFTVTGLLLLQERKLGHQEISDVMIVANAFSLWTGILFLLDMVFMIKHFDTKSDSDRIRVRWKTIYTAVGPKGEKKQGLKHHKETPQFAKEELAKDPNLVTVTDDKRLPATEFTDPNKLFKITGAEPMDYAEYVKKKSEMYPEEKPLSYEDYMFLKYPPALIKNVPLTNKEYLDNFKKTNQPGEPLSLDEFITKRNELTKKGEDPLTFDEFTERFKLLNVTEGKPLSYPEYFKKELEVYPENETPLTPERYKMLSALLNRKEKPPLGYLGYLKKHNKAFPEDGPLNQEEYTKLKKLVDDEKPESMSYDTYLPNYNENFPGGETLAFPEFIKQLSIVDEDSDPLPYAKYLKKHDEKYPEEMPSTIDELAHLSTVLNDASPEPYPYESYLESLEKYYPGKTPMLYPEFTKQCDLIHEAKQPLPYEEYLELHEDTYPGEEALSEEKLEDLSEQLKYVDPEPLKYTDYLKNYDEKFPGEEPLSLDDFMKECNLLNGKGKPLSYDDYVDKFTEEYPADTASSNEPFSKLNKLVSDAEPETLSYNEYLENKKEDFPEEETLSREEFLNNLEILKPGSLPMSYEKYLQGHENPLTGDKFNDLKQQLQAAKPEALAYDDYVQNFIKHFPGEEPLPFEEFIKECNLLNGKGNLLPYDKYVRKHNRVYPNEKPLRDDKYLDLSKQLKDAEPTPLRYQNYLNNYDKNFPGEDPLSLEDFKKECDLLRKRADPISYPEYKKRHIKSNPGEEVLPKNKFNDLAGELTDAEPDLLSYDEYLEANNKNFPGETLLPLADFLKECNIIKKKIPPKLYSEYLTAQKQMYPKEEPISEEKYLGLRDQLTKPNDELVTYEQYLDTQNQINPEEIPISDEEFIKLRSVIENEPILCGAYLKLQKELYPEESPLSKPNFNKLYNLLDTDTRKSYADYLKKHNKNYPGEEPLSMKEFLKLRDMFNLLDNELSEQQQIITCGDLCSRRNDPDAFPYTSLLSVTERYLKSQEDLKSFCTTRIPLDSLDSLLKKDSYIEKKKDSSDGKKKEYREKKKSISQRRYTSIDNKFDMSEEEKTQLLEKITKLGEKIKFLEARSKHDDRLKPDGPTTRKRSPQLSEKDRSQSDPRIQSSTTDDLRQIFEMKEELEELKMEFLYICSDDEVRKIRQYVKFCDQSEMDLDIRAQICSICKTKCDNDPKRCFAEVKQRIEKTKNYPIRSHGSLTDICPICKSACDDDPNKCLIELKKMLDIDKLMEIRNELRTEEEKAEEAESLSRLRKCPICNSPCNDPENCVANLEKRMKDEAREATKYCRPKQAIVCPVCKMDADHDAKTCLANLKKRVREEKDCPVIITEDTPLDDKKSTPISNEKNTSISDEEDSSSKICPVCKSICENDNKKCLENLKNKINLCDHEDLRDDSQFRSTQKSEKDDDDFECTKTGPKQIIHPGSHRGPESKSTEKCEIGEYDLGDEKTKQDETMYSESPREPVSKSTEKCGIDEHDLVRVKREKDEMMYSESSREPVSKSTEKCEIDKHDLESAKTEKERTIHPESSRGRELCAICKSYCDGDAEVCLVEAERLKCAEACLEQISALRREIEMLSAQESASDERIGTVSRPTCGKNPAECTKTTWQRKPTNKTDDSSSMSDTPESGRNKKKPTCTQRSSEKERNPTKKETSPSKKKVDGVTQSGNDLPEATEARKKHRKKDTKSNESSSDTSSATR